MAITRRLSLAVILAVFSVAVVNAGEVARIEPLIAAPSAETGEMTNDTPHLWFVELSSPPMTEGTSSAVVRGEKQSFRSEAKRKGLRYRVRREFNDLWNGLSISMPASELGKLNDIPGVKAVYPIATIPIPETSALSDPELYTALTMTGADVAQSELGYSGHGVKVAIMDTGIDYDHPDLGGCFGPGCRVAYGYDLVGDDFNADPTSPSYNPVPTPDADPDDCQGHGTHVSGITGANGAVVGVAPEVTFGAYRVFGCEGSTTSDIMLAAMELALKDKMDVLNMSIGASFQWPQYPTAQGADRLVKRGMVVVASIGNSGAFGLYAAGAPGVGEKVIGVASFDNSHTVLPYFEVNSEKVGYVPMTYAGPTPTSGTEEIVYVGQGCNADLPLLADPAGKVALINRGACSFSEKATNAIAAGATGVVIHNSSPGVFNGTLGAPIDGVTPVVGISLEHGTYIRAQADPIYMTWTDQQDSFLSPTGGLISSFSSYGLAPDLSIKPDIGAPGGNIYSTYPIEKGEYAIMGGTSMASPHVAGAVALLLEAHPWTRAYRVRDILQNSADPQFWSLGPSYGLLDHVYRQGAGMLDIDDAILAKTRITPGKLAVGEGEAGPKTFKLKIKNYSRHPVVYDLSWESAIAASGVIDIDGYWLTDEEVSFSKDQIKIRPRRSARVKVTITPATGPAFGMYSGYIVFTPQGEGQVYRVPYAGYVGDYQGIEVLARTYGLPVLSAGSDYDPILDDGHVFTLAGDDLPYFLLQLYHQSEELIFKIYDADTGRPIHRFFNRALDFEYFGRNAATTSYFAFAWDGTRIVNRCPHKRAYHKRGHHRCGHFKPPSMELTKDVPDGNYFIEVKVLKALGDRRNPDHWESWTSPAFVIDRP